jgi:hypothetical protein
MWLETLSGGLLGGMLRLAPEILKVLDRKSERAHEKDMMQISVQADDARAKAELAIQHAQAEAVFDAGAMQALLEGVKAQSVRSGVRWVDALNTLVRPSITFALFGLYAVCRIATFIAGISSGVPPLEVLRGTWTQDDQVVLSGILNFWFLGRVFDKVTR